MFGLDPLQKRLEEMEEEQASPSSRIRRNPIIELTDRLYFLRRNLSNSVERAPEYLAIAKRWGETVYRAPKTVKDGETLYGPEVRHLEGIEVPSRISDFGRWSVFPVQGFGIDTYALENGVKEPTHFLSLKPVNGSYRFAVRPA